MFLLLLLRGNTLLIAISYYAIQIVMASAAANGATLKATHIIQLTANNDNHKEKMSINVVKHITTDGHQIDGDNNNNNDDDILPTDDGYDGRIIGGQKTSIANYPYQVSVQHQGAHICGGSIIMPNVILTAAHCIENPQDVDAFHVRAGSTTHLRGGQLRRVHQIIKHESYTLTNLDCDVALMVLSNNLTYNRKVKSVQLAVANAVVPGQEPLYVSGWGLTSETGSVSAYLNHVAVCLINRHNCAKNYQFVATITRQMFCAGYPQGGRDSCQGDSGGPLVVNYVAAQQAAKATNDTLSPSLPLTSFASLPLWSPPTSPFPAAAAPTESLATPSRRVAKGPIQYGIVSWGVGCAQEGYPGVYTDVGALRPWIDGKLREINHMYNK